MHAYVHARRTIMKVVIQVCKQASVKVDGIIHNQINNGYVLLVGIDKNDNFTITLDNSNRQHVNIITSMLKESDFSILEEGINNSGDYYISANKYK